MESTARFITVKTTDDEGSGELEIAGDAGPTGPFTTIDPDELEVEDLSDDLEPAEDSVKVRMPVEPGPKLTVPASTFSLGLSTTDSESSDLDWGEEEAATRALAETHQTSLGMPAPPVPADAISVPPSALEATPSMDDFVSAPTMGVSSMAPSPAPAASPVISPFVLVADVESPPPPPVPPQPYFPPPAPLYDALGKPSARPAFQSEPEGLALPITRAIPERTSPATPALTAAADTFAEDEVAAAPRRGGGIVIGVVVGLLIAAGIGAAVWMLFLREKPGTLVFRAPADATVAIDQLPVQGVSGLFVVRDLRPGTHAVLVTRAGSPPWAQAVDVPAGGRIELEAPGTQEAQAALHAPAAPPATSAPPEGQPEGATADQVPPAAGASQPGTVHTPVQTAPRPLAGGTATGVTGITAGRGFLSVNTVPWSQVEIDGRGIGNTPLRHFEVRAGNRVVTLIVPAWNIRQSRRVTIVPGQEATITVRFQEPGRPGAGAGPMGPGPMGPGPGPMGPGPGPGPMGPGPGPTGPGPMGPRPMGPGPGQMGPPR